jgi:transposase
MIRNLSKYINAFDCKHTNGYTECTNNAINMIKRNAFGFRNFNKALYFTWG